MSRSLALLVSSFTLFGCAAGPATAPPMPSGSAPLVSASLGFGDSPVQGYIYLQPPQGTRGWSYSVDVNEDGEADHQGVLEERAAFAYRFTTPGAHRVAVTLRGTGETETIEVPVIVNDPGAIRILTQRHIVPPDPMASNSFQGITTNHAGTTLYVADRWGLALYQLDANDLRQLGPPLELTLLLRGLEGLSVAPSDSLLFVAHKDFGLSVVAIPRMELLHSHRADGAFFVHAESDTTALMSSDARDFHRIDSRTGAATSTLAVPSPWHFAVSQNGTLVAVLDDYGSAVHLAHLPGLHAQARIELPGLTRAGTVAFDPSGNRLYVLGQGVDGGRFMVVDVSTREILLSLALGPHECTWCAANPAATSPGGRFVAMEWAGGMYFIDTELDLPLYHFGPYGGDGLSVAASPIHDEFYLLKYDGLLTRISIGE